MKSIIRVGARVSVVSLLVAMFAIAVPLSASASPETLKRSVSNMTQGPLDMVLSPVVSAINMTRKVRDVDDSTAVRVIFFAPGYVWYTGVVFGGGALRIITGAIEFIPGLLLMPFDADLDPLFDPVDRAPAIVDLDTPCCYDVKFGIDYTTPEY